VLRDVIRENLQWRDERHPDLWLYPSAGSIFQKIRTWARPPDRPVRPQGARAGERAVLPQARQHHREPGRRHREDVRGLIDLAQTTVKRELGHELKTEIGMIGEF
jgi:UDP-N-acetylenolpyruvoylglucosamine reductase